MPNQDAFFGRLVFRGVIAFCAAIIFACTLWTVWAIGPAVERQWRPVTGKLEITSKVEIEPGVVELRARYRKIRDCEYVSAGWYVGNPNGDYREVRVQNIIETDQLRIANTSRPVGTSDIGPWRVGMSLDELNSNSFAIITHRCHPFWLTTTQFYP
jgi:hypothetical protein